MVLLIFFIELHIPPTAAATLTNGPMPPQMGVSLKRLVQFTERSDGRAEIGPILEWMTIPRSRRVTNIPLPILNISSLQVIGV